MQRQLTTLVLCLVVVVSAAACFSSEDSATKSPVVPILRVGQRVKFERALSGGYNVNILNDRYVKSYTTYFPPEVIDVSPGFIVVDAGRGITKTVFAHAIDEITQLPDVQDDAAKPDPKVKPKN